MLSTCRPNWFEGKEEKEEKENQILQKKIKLEPDNTKSNVISTKYGLEDEKKNKNSMILDTIMIQNFEHFHPCSNQFNMSYRTRRCCTSICICLIEALTRLGNISKIEWKVDIFIVGADLNEAWNRRNDHPHVAHLPLVIELFEIIQQSKDTFIIGDCKNGMLRPDADKSSGQESEEENYDNDLTHLLSTNLVKEFDFVLFTIRDISFLVGKYCGKYFLFDSHGHAKLPPRDKSFVIYTKTTLDLAKLIITFYYKQPKTEEIKDVLCNQFNAYYVKLK